MTPKMKPREDSSKKAVREYAEATKGNKIPRRTAAKKGVHAAAKSERRGWKGYA